jgi:S1-C subfamily serine protease
MPSRLWLCVVSGGARGGLVEITREPVTIGSGQNTTLQILGPGVAPLHASVARNGAGGVTVRSLAGGTSVAVDGRPVRGEEVVQPPAEVQIAGIRLLISPEAPDFGALAAKHARLDEAMAATEGPRRRRRPNRRTIAVPALVLGAGAVVWAALALSEGGEAPRGDIARAVRLAGPGTVLVRASSGDGSGWVADARRGLVVTNFHVVEGARGLAVVASGRAHGAALYAAAPCEDVAVLRAPGLVHTRALELGGDRRLADGSLVVALGFPANATGAPRLTSTAGVVSVASARLPATSAGSPSLPDVVQTDAHLNPGGSGGPLVDTRGRVIGMATAVLTSVGGTPVQGQSYAIAAPRLRLVLAALDRGRSIGWPGASMSFAGGQARVDGRRVATIAGRAVGSSLTAYCAAVRGVRGTVPVTLRGARTVRMGF